MGREPGPFAEASTHKREKRTTGGLIRQGSFLRDGGVFGIAVPGVFGQRTGLNLALAFLDPARSTPGAVFPFGMRVLLCRAPVIPRCPLDSDPASLR